jgi:hypothetical protein
MLLGLPYKVWENVLITLKLDCLQALYEYYKLHKGYDHQIRAHRQTGTVAIYRHLKKGFYIFIMENGSFALFLE